MDSQELLERIKLIKKDQLWGVLNLGGKGLLVISVAYLLASTVSTLTVAFMIDTASFKAGTSGPLAAADRVLLVNNVNYHALKKDVLDRNLFNSAGDYPEETEGPLADGGNANVFDENAPCRKASLNIELLGTIYLGNARGSLATVREKGIEEADIYRAGDRIIGSEQAKVHKIEQQRMIINNNGVKECLELAPPSNILANLNSGSQTTSGNPAAPGAMPGGGGEGGCGNVVLEEAYVQSQLGEGFATILSKGRLIPHNNESQMVGFKLIGVDANSLFGKVCLKNGDVITQVNDTSLQQPDQGFALYQAFQDERDVRINLLRDGKTPMTVTIQIK